MDRSVSSSTESGRVQIADVKEIPAWTGRYVSTPNPTADSPCMSILGSSRSTSPVSFGTSPPTSYAGSYFDDGSQSSDAQSKRSPFVGRTRSESANSRQWLQPTSEVRRTDTLKPRLSYMYSKRTGSTQSRLVQMDGALDQEPHRHSSEIQNISLLDGDEAQNVPSVRVCLTADDEIGEDLDDISIPFVDPFTGEQLLDERRISTASGISAYLRPNAFAGHRDTFARIHPLRDTDSSLGTASHVQYPQHSPRTKIFAAIQLPAEILHHIFQYLNPCDFDAARHTCRSWYLASLDRAISRRIMKQAGCYPAFLADIEHRRQLLHAQQLRRIRSKADDCDGEDNEDFSEEWIVSKRLATECRLSAAWHKSGFSIESGHSKSRLVATQTVQFEKLLDGSSGSMDSSAHCKRFTISTCGKFVLVIAGTDVFVYTFAGEGSSMKPCVRLVTGKEVQSVSMDTSSGRYAVAALLAGRVGVYWDIDDVLVTSSVTTRHEDDASQREDTTSQRSPVPIITKPTKIYANVGTSSDEPRSVAICPQRKCVAFGCRTGIELYWTDAVTGRDLNRWFPLAAPGDHLYFLPPRPGIDSTKKLRMISSATRPIPRPSDRQHSSPSIVRFSQNEPRYGRQQSMTTLFFGDNPYPSPLDRRASRPLNIHEQPSEGILRAMDCDHFKAVPLSDGTHMLYTEPTSGLLCLGSDAPLGGPTKLVRKVCMVPPTSNNTQIGSLSCYAAGQDLNWGVRIVAAHNDGSIVLYNIPSDCFERIRHVRSTLDIWDELSGVVGQSDLLMDALINANNSNDTVSTDDTPTPGSPTSFRSLQIHGAVIARFDSEVADLKVNCSGGGLRVWIFSQNGSATKMDVYAPRHHQIEQLAVGVDGVLYKDDRFAYHTKIESSLSADEEDAKADSKQRVTFMGLDGACDIGDCETSCSFSNFEHQLALLEELNAKAILATPEEVPSAGGQLMMERHAARLQVEVLTDFRNAMLPSPYLFSLD